MTSFLDFYSPEDRKWLTQLVPNTESLDPDIRASIAAIERRKREILKFQREQERKAKLLEESEDE